MARTSLSTKFQVVIPKEVRERFPLKPGQRFTVHEDSGVIYLVPEIPLRKLRGILRNRGVTLENLRDKSNRPL